MQSSSFTTRELLNFDKISLMTGESPGGLEVQGTQVSVRSSRVAILIRRAILV